MTEGTGAAKLLDANAMLTALDTGGMDAMVRLMESDEEAYGDGTAALLAVCLVKNVFDAMLPIMRDHGINVTWGTILSTSARGFLADGG